MKKQIALLAALVLACGAPIGTASWQGFGFTASAQNNKVTGVVRDGNGEPLIGATVQVKGTNRVTATDIDGKYSIQAAPGSTLEIKYVGSPTKEVRVSGSTMDINMSEANNTLDEVVVTALGIKRDRKALGYAVEDLKAEELMRNNYLVEESVVLGELNIDVSAWVNSHSLVADVRDLNLTIATGTQVEAAVDVGSSGASSTNL